MQEEIQIFFNGSGRIDNNSNENNGDIASANGMLSFPIESLVPMYGWSSLCMGPSLHVEPPVPTLRTNGMPYYLTNNQQVHESLMK